LSPLLVICVTSKLIWSVKTALDTNQWQHRVCQQELTVCLLMV